MATLTYKVWQIWMKAEGMYFIQVPDVCGIQRQCHPVADATPQRHA